MADGSHGDYERVLASGTFIYDGNHDGNSGSCHRSNDDQLADHVAIELEDSLGEEEDTLPADWMPAGWMEDVLSCVAEKVPQLKAQMECDGALLPTTTSCMGAASCATWCEAVEAMEAAEKAEEEAEQAEALASAGRWVPAVG